MKIFFSVYWWIHHMDHFELNTLRLRQNGRHFPDENFKCISFNENVWIWIKISLKFVPKSPISNIPALVQIMAWRRAGDKPLFEPMVFKLPTDIIAKDPEGLDSRSVNPAERWRENPARALARAGFSQHLKCGIHRSESSPEGSFALIPQPVARLAKTTP